MTDKNVRPYRMTSIVVTSMESVKHKKPIFLIWYNFDLQSTFYAFLGGKQAILDLISVKI